MIHVAPDEIEEAKADIAWWRERLPPGWRLCAFTWRRKASWADTAENRYEVDGPVIDAIWKHARASSPVAAPSGNK